MWQYKFLPEIQEFLQEQIKGNKNTTNSDLEAFGFVFIFLILEHYISIMHLYLALYCDSLINKSVSHSNENHQSLTHTIPFDRGR